MTSLSKVLTQSLAWLLISPMGLEPQATCCSLTYSLCPLLPWLAMGHADAQGPGHNTSTTDLRNATCSTGRHLLVGALARSFSTISSRCPQAKHLTPSMIIHNTQSLTSARDMFRAYPTRPLVNPSKNVILLTHVRHSVSRRRRELFTSRHR